MHLWRTYNGRGCGSGSGNASKNASLWVQKDAARGSVRRVRLARRKKRIHCGWYLAFLLAFNAAAGGRGILFLPRGKLDAFF